MVDSRTEENASSPTNPEKQEISQLVKCRMQSLGQPLTDYDEVSDKKDTVSYPIINPSFDLKLELDDIIYLIRPSSLSPKPSPLIDERKLLQAQRQQYTRGEPTGADKSELAQVDAEAKQKSGGRIVKDGNSRIPIIYTDSDDDIDITTEHDKTTSENTERNKNIPTFGLDVDSEINGNDETDISDSEASPQVIRGTVV